MLAEMAERWQLLALDLITEFTQIQAIDGKDESEVVDKLVRCLQDMLPLTRLAVVFFDRDFSPYIRQSWCAEEVSSFDLDLEELISSGQFGQASGQFQLVNVKSTSIAQNTFMHSLYAGDKLLGMLLGTWRMQVKPTLAMSKSLSIVLDSATYTIENIRLSARVERQRKELENTVAARTQELEYLNQFDLITNLLNRTSFRRDLDLQLMANQTINVIYMDLNNFTNINSTWGFDVGDKVLLSVADRLQAIVDVDFASDEIKLARLGGDSFGFSLIGEKWCHRDNIDALLQAINTSLGLPVDIDDYSISLSYHIGISAGQGVSDESQMLLTRAELAMRDAVQVGVNACIFYEDKPDDLSRTADMSLESALGLAMQENQLELYYQPKVCLKTGNIVGAEALLRWIHPELGFVSPAAFIPLAERSRMIHHIGLWCMDKACQQLSFWRDEGYPHLHLSVNLSSQQLHEPELVDEISACIRRYQINPACLEIELTESVMAHHPQAMSDTLKGLRDLGVKLSIDDFGTGYSSLLQLKRFPADVLKIDRAFVDGIRPDTANAAVVKSVVYLAQQLSMKTVAEGVEDHDEMLYIKELGCDMIQGYYVSEALNKNKFGHLLQSWSGL